MTYWPAAERILTHWLAERERELDRARLHVEQALEEKAEARERFERADAALKDAQFELMRAEGRAQATLEALADLRYVADGDEATRATGCEE